MGSSFARHHLKRTHYQTVIRAVNRQRYVFPAFYSCGVNHRYMFLNRHSSCMNHGHTFPTCHSYEVAYMPHAAIRLASKILEWIFETSPSTSCVLKPPTGGSSAFAVPREFVSISESSGLFVKALVLWKSHTCYGINEICTAEVVRKKSSLSPILTLSMKDLL